MGRPPTRLSPSDCHRIRAFLEDTELPCSVIGSKCGVNKRTVERMKTNLELFGSFYPPAFNRRGRPRALTIAEEEWLLLYLEDQPTAYMDELALVLWDKFAVDVVPQVVGRVLKRNGWSRKKAKEIAKQRSAKARALWRQKQELWQLDRLCFIDESACNERTGCRKRGWSPVGSKCSILRFLERTERWSVLPALTVNGYLPEPLILQGAVDKEVFRWWLVNCVIPHLQPDSIIIMDNASIHHNLGPDIDQILAIRGLRIEYLPPYSPDLNPIETTFATLKAWVKRNIWRLEFFANFGDFMKVAIASSVDSGARQYFVNCGYQD